MLENSKEGNVQRSAKFGIQAFFGGCIGCLGAWVTSVFIILLASFIFGSVFYNSIVSFGKAVKSLTEEIPSILQGNRGPFSMEQESVSATPTGTLPQLQVYMTQGDDPQGKAITSVTQAESPQMYFWVKAGKGVNVTFTLWLTNAEGSKSQFGPSFITKSDGSPRSCGRFATEAPVGDYLMQALIGNTVVGDLRFSVIPTK